MGGHDLKPGYDFARRADFWALVIICAGTIARLWIVASGQLNLVQDEAQYWDWTRHLQLTYYSKGPLIAWIIHFWTSIFGDTELGVRFGALFGSVLTQVVIYCGLSKMWKRPVVALWTLFIANTAPFFLASGLLMTTDNPFVLCFGVCIFCLHAAAQGREGRATTWPFVFMGLFLALGILAKYTMLGFPPLAFFFGLIMAWRKELPQGFWRRFWASLSFGIALGFLPTFIWNVQHDFVGYKHVFFLIGVSGKDAGQLIRFDRFPDYIGSQAGLITPWWLIFMLLGGAQAVRNCLGIASVKDGHGADMGLDFQKSLLLAVFFWPIWLFFLAWSFHSKVLPNWSAVSYVAGFILCGFYFDWFWRQSVSRWARYKRVWVSLGILVFLVLHFSYLLPLPDAVNPLHRVKGWTDLGSKVHELQQTEFEDPSKVFIFSDLYDMTAALAFYVPGQPRTYCAWLDRRMNQYDMWPGPQDKKGWNAIYVAKRFHDIPEKGVDKMFKHVSPPIKYQTTFKGSPARKFTIFLCYDYNGTWPRDNSGQF